MLTHRNDVMQQHKQIVTQINTLRYNNVLLAECFCVYSEACKIAIHLILKFQMIEIKETGFKLDTKYNWEHDL